MSIKNEIKANIKSILDKLNIEVPDNQINVEVPANKKNGDYYGCPSLSHFMDELQL